LEAIVTGHNLAEIHVVLGDSGLSAAGRNKTLIKEGNWLRRRALSAVRGFPRVPSPGCVRIIPPKGPGFRPAMVDSRRFGGRSFGVQETAGRGMRRMTTGERSFSIIGMVVGRKDQTRKGIRFIEWFGA
jgi:hypothetical protein